MKHIIYGLIDPNTNEIRYIGYTSNQKRRYQQHHNPSFLRSNNYKNNWIKSLLAKGQKAEMIEICEYETAEELPMAEVMWIKNYRILGCNLTNSTDGGDCSPLQGKHHTDEIKVQISQTIKNKHQVAWNKGLKGVLKAWNKGLPATNKGKPHTEETKKKISQIAKLRRWKLIDGKRIYYKKEEVSFDTSSDKTKLV